MNSAQMTPALPIAEGFHDWRASAPCSTVDPDMFFDAAEEDPMVEAQAKALCGGCQFRESCLSAAMIGNDEWGIWGGMTPSERESYKPMWERMNGGKSQVRIMRENNGIVMRDPSVDRRYTARLKAAQECRELLLASAHTYRRNEFLSILELIISHPVEDSGRLARRIGISKAWFNTVKREAYSLVGVKEIYEKEDGVA